MVAQLQVERVGVQVSLIRQIRLMVLAHEMVHQGDGNDQWQNALTVIADQFQQLLLFISGKLLFKIPHDVHEHVGVLGGRSLEVQCLQQHGRIGSCQGGKTGSDLP